MLDNFTSKIINYFKVLYTSILGGLLKVPQTLKKPGFRKTLFKFLLVIITFFCMALFIIWAIKNLIAWVSELINYYSVYLVGIGVIALLIYNWLEDKKKAIERQRQEELKKQAKQARTQYNYLKNFMFRILYDPHFCELTELVRPLTINNINVNPAYEVDEKTYIVRFHFKADKRSVEPLEKGVDNIINLLQSVITNKVETVGIEGICPPARDNLQSVIAIHEVVDCGSYVRISLVFDNDAYREAMQSQQMAVQPFLPEDRYIK